MTPDGPIKDWLDLTLAAAALVAVVVGWVKVIRPRVRRARAEVVAARDALLGRDAITDSITGAVISPALPGIGPRVAGLEESHTLLASAVAKLTEQNAALGVLVAKVDTLEKHVDGWEERDRAHATVIADHGDRLGRLERAAVERVVSKAEQQAAWSAIEAVAKNDEPN